MKYVVIRMGNREVPLIFPDQMVHAHVAGTIKAMIAEETRLVLGYEQNDPVWVRVKPGIIAELVAVAAGTIDINRLVCSGSSETLDLQSRGEQDARPGLRG